MFWVYTAAITFDLKFSYVLVGWEGSAYDSWVLNDALNRPKGLQIPKDILGLKSDFLFIMDSMVMLVMELWSIILVMLGRY